MSEISETYVPANLELEDNYHRLQPADLEFFAQQTGISDPAALKEHITLVQREAYAVHPYPCIRLLGFARLKISRLPPYQALLQLGKERPGALFLDIGCCVGNDVRKAVADGFPMQQALASDLRPEFWEIGHKLFKTTPAEFTVPFLAGDAFDDAFLAPAPIASRPPTDAPPALASLTALTPLHARLSAIHASSLFHLFSEAQQLVLARRLASLLSPVPGSMIFGMHGGRPEKGERVEARMPTSHGTRMFCHCPESWVALWTTEVFGPGEVKVDAQLVEVERVDLNGIDGGKFWMMIWCVTRL